LLERRFVETLAGMSTDDRIRWDEAHRRPDDPLERPSPFFAEHWALLPVGRTLDLACGRGRHARVLAEHGHAVVAVDVSAVALASRSLVHERILRVRMDLDAAAFRSGAFDAIVVVSFLDRGLFEAIASWLRPGGVLLYETFLAADAAVGHPKNPRFLLAPNEILERVREGYEILRHREGETSSDGRRTHRAGIVARRRGGPVA
jgi:SAM-dependent methyltransferase